MCQFQVLTDAGFVLLLPRLARQSLIELTAHQASHESDPNFKQRFFENVRVVSIVTTKTSVLVRIHRAAEVSKDNRCRRVIQQDATYLLNFEFQEFARLEGVDAFTRSRALDTIRKLLRYAKETMCPLLQKAASAICTKLNDPKSDLFAMRSDIDTYRHGQPGIETKYRSARGQV